MATEYRNKRDGEIQEEFEALCDVVRRQVGRELLRLTRDNVLSDADAHRIVGRRLWDKRESQRYIGEVGCPICRDENRIFLGEMSESAAGGVLFIDDKSCEKRGGEHIGSFHTHATGGTYPSAEDIGRSISEEEKIMCIGGNIGGGVGVTCYYPRESTRMHGLVYDSDTGEYYPPVTGVTPLGKVEFYREFPLPTPEEILKFAEDNRDEVVRVLAEYNDIPGDDPKMPKLIDEFIETLKSGEIPKCVGDEGEPDWDLATLELYAGHDLPRVERKMREFLEKDLYICRLW